MKRRNELTNDYIQGAVEDVATSASSKMEMPQLMVNDVTEGEVQVDNSLVSIFYDKGSFIEFPEEGEFQALVLSSDQPECMMMSAADETTLSKMDQLQVLVDLFHND